MGANNFHIFVYIASMLLGTAAATMVFVMNLKQRGHIQRSLNVFFPLILLYSMADFVTYYYLFEIVPENVIYALVTLSDTLYIIMSGAWLYVIIVMAGLENKIRLKYVLIVTCVYLLFQEGLSAVFGKYEGGRIITNPMFVRYLLQALCIAFALINLSVSGFCAYKIIRSKEKNAERILNLIFSVSFICYAIWVAYWDYDVWFSLRNGFAEDYAEDLIFIIYFILSISMAVYFIKCGPLDSSVHRAGDGIISEEAVRMLQERYSLTEREREVLSEISRGKGNAQIAETLSISENTVKRHVNSIMKKTGSHNRHEILFKLTQ